MGTRREVAGALESDLQAAFVEWSERQRIQVAISPITRAFEMEAVRDYLVMIPNGIQLPGSKLNRAKYMARLKKLGLHEGAYDLLIALPAANYHGLWMEWKSETGKASKDQEKFGRKMDRVGYRTVIVNDLVKAIGFTMDYLRQGKYVR